MRDNRHQFTRRRFVETAALAAGSLGSMRVTRAAAMAADVKIGLYSITYGGVWYRGDALTLDVFKSEYHKLLETYFAENFTLDPALDLESLRIPHFYHAFYVYKYATGISAAVALSEQVLSGKADSVNAYLDFLRSGGSKFPLETLQAAGVDMTTPAPIESTLRLFERRLDDLESLLL